MKCSACEKAGQRSKVFIDGPRVSNLAILSYYDEDGDLHVHDPNERTINYSCSNHHHWHKTDKQECHVCKTKGT